MRLSDGTLRGKTVIGADGVAVGAVAALFLDSDAWRVEAIQVKLEPEVADRLGASRSFFRSGELEIPVALVQSVRDAVVLTVAVDGLRQILSAEPDIDPLPPPA